MSEELVYIYQDTTGLPEYARQISLAKKDKDLWIAIANFNKDNKELQIHASYMPIDKALEMAYAIIDKLGDK